MVNNLGQWIYTSDTPEDEKCDYDRIADWIIKSGYKVKTTIEHLTTMIIGIFDCPDYYGEYNPETGGSGYGDGFTIDGCKQFVEDSGGFAEFDYYC